MDTIKIHIYLLNKRELIENDLLLFNFLIELQNFFNILSL